nr:hypothetical transcript [Hymenolepis microstoma]
MSASKLSAIECSGWNSPPPHTLPHSDINDSQSTQHTLAFTSNVKSNAEFFLRSYFRLSVVDPIACDRRPYHLIGAPFFTDTLRLINSSRLPSDLYEVASDFVSDFRLKTFSVVMEELSPTEANHHIHTLPLVTKNRNFNAIIVDQLC